MNSLVFTTNKRITRVKINRFDDDIVKAKCKGNCVSQTQGISNYGIQSL